MDATLYPVATLADIAEETGVKRYTLGFVVSDPWDAGGCTGSWGGYYTLEAGPDSWGEDGQYFLYDQVDSLRALGGDVALSFGGASSQELAETCLEVGALAAEYRRAIDATSVTRIDFDIEGAALTHNEEGGANSRRAQAIALLQAEMEEAGRPLSVWFTLPTLPSGLTEAGVSMLDRLLEEGVALAGVNVMTMDYGDGAAPDPDGQMGEYGIEAMESLHVQYGTLLENHGESVSDAALWGRIGSTPMIGRNDVVSEVFYLSDAQETRVFAEEHGVGMLSMWSVNRDHPCPETETVSLTCSSTPDQTEDWEFMGIFQGYGE